jgi:mono/diheme cytochrome c family protein
MRSAAYLILMSSMVLLGGCKVGHPSKVESRVMFFTKHHITVGNKSAKNPLAFNDKNMADGKEAFGYYCVVCHGMDGRNTGVPFADNLSPPLPSLASPEVQSYTDGQLKWILDNGLSPSGMPASKGTLSDDELWSIVLFLRHLPPEGSQGEPPAYTH